MHFYQKKKKKKKKMLIALLHFLQKFEILLSLYLPVAFF